MCNFFNWGGKKSVFSAPNSDESLNIIHLLDELLVLENRLAWIGLQLKLEKDAEAADV